MRKILLILFLLNIGATIDWTSTKIVTTEVSMGTWTITKVTRPPTETEIKEYNTKVICSERIMAYENSFKRPKGQNYTIVTPDSVIQKIIAVTIKDIDSKIITMPTKIIK